MDEIPTGAPSPASDHDYRLLVDAITDYAIYMLSPEGIVTNWNAGAQRSKGYLAEEIVGCHFSQFYTEEDRATGLPARALELAAREGKFETEGWRLRKDGSRYWAHVVVDPIRDASGEILGYAKITRDLTERRATEQILRRSEEQFRLLVQSVTDYAIYMLDLDGKVTSWNAGAAHIKGYSPEEIIGQHFSRFYSEEDRAAGMPDRALNIARQQGRYAAEGRRVRKDGAEFQASVVIDAVHDDQGELIGFAKITRDVTERAQAQKQLELAREALFQSQKMEAIGQLTGGIAHDFNNLLMTILSSLELLDRRLVDDPVGRKLLANAVSGAQRGATLTSRMLAFARRQDMNAVRVDIPAMVADMADLLQRSLGPAWQVQTRFPCDLSAVDADLNQLEMALLNLVVNARDAIPDGGTITIEARDCHLPDAVAAPLPPGDYVKLAVIDHGTGMDADTLARATEPFFTTKGVGKGTGLGLSMIHGFAQQLGGQFVLESQAGLGTTAEIWLPVAKAAAPSLPVTAPAEAPAQGAPLTILTVDDDALILMNTTAMLEDMGHTVIEAYSGAEALEVVRTTRGIDLMITDYAMPGISGAELIDTVRAEFPEIQVVLASGYGELPSEPRFAVRRLGKPFTQKDLARAVSAATLGAKPGSDALGSLHVG